MSEATTQETRERESHAQANAYAHFESIRALAEARMILAAAENDEYADSIDEISDFVEWSNDDSEGITGVDCELLDVDAIEVDSVGSIYSVTCEGTRFDSLDAIDEHLHNIPLAIEVRSGWQPVGETLEPAEFAILLSTGGPACRIRGELNEHNEPDRAWLEYQDWFMPWAQYVGLDSDVLVEFARSFHFGE